MQSIIIERVIIRLDSSQCQSLTVCSFHFAPNGVDRMDATADVSPSVESCIHAADAGARALMPPTVLSHIFKSAWTNCWLYYSLSAIV